MVARSIAISFCFLLAGLVLASLPLVPRATTDRPMIEDAVTVGQRVIEDTGTVGERAIEDTAIADQPMIEDLGQGPNRRAVKIAGETGVASIYGFAGDKTAGGKKTANGENIRPTDMSAAHKSIPFGTKVRVTNLVNGWSAVVRINNRGPFTKGRIIDLTPTAAAALGFSAEKEGLAPVTLTVLKE
jgi:rare lipoprotein A